MTSKRLIKMYGYWQLTEVVAYLRRYTRACLIDKTNNKIVRVLAEKCTSTGTKLYGYWQRNVRVLAEITEEKTALNLIA